MCDQGSWLVMQQLKLIGAYDLHHKNISHDMAKSILYPVIIYTVWFIWYCSPPGNPLYYILWMTTGICDLTGVIFHTGFVVNSLALGFE